MRLAAKTISYGTLHVGVATCVAYAMTGNFGIALGIGLVEPLVQTLVFPLHELAWERAPKRRQSLARNHEAHNGEPSFCPLHRHAQTP